MIFLFSVQKYKLLFAIVRPYHVQPPSVNILIDSALIYPNYKKLTFS
ncbi:hypothetical protein FHS10_003038 [Mucilaginibacter dorajii]|nr:hypothetical protein [Mucilaginibacter dorajii]